LSNEKDAKWLGVAKAVSSMSKDPSTKVGCVLTDWEYRHISSGYNGFVAGCDESLLTWERPLKYKLVIHAEMNAMHFAARADLSRTRLYCTHAPCYDCLKHMLQRGVRYVRYDEFDSVVERWPAEDLEAIVRLMSACNNRHSTAMDCQDIHGGNYWSMVEKKLEFLRGEK